MVGLRPNLKRFSLACDLGRGRPARRKSDRDGRAPRKKGRVPMQTSISFEQQHFLVTLDRQSRTFESVSRRDQFSEDAFGGTKIWGLSSPVPMLPSVLSG